MHERAAWRVGTDRTRRHDIRHNAPACLPSTTSSPCSNLEAIARGLAGGNLYTTDGVLAISVVQEGLVRVKQQ